MSYIKHVTGKLKQVFQESQTSTKEIDRSHEPKPKKDKNGNYIFDRSKPYGSSENPVVVGMPEHSDVLVFDRANNRWILTDGAGNGWIR